MCRGDGRQIDLDDDGAEKGGFVGPYTTDVVVIGAKDEKGGSSPRFPS